MDILGDDDIITARQESRTLAAEIGFSPADQAMLVAVVTELARNIVEHAERGEVLLQAMENAGRRGIDIVARDLGPGIAQTPEAVQASHSVAGRMGVGLSGVKGLMDSLDIISVPGKGTTITARKWLS